MRLATLVLSLLACSSWLSAQAQSIDEQPAQRFGSWVDIGVDRNPGGTDTPLAVTVDLGFTYGPGNLFAGGSGGFGISAGEANSGPYYYDSSVDRCRDSRNGQFANSSNCSATGTAYTLRGIAGYRFLETGGASWSAFGGIQKGGTSGTTQDGAATIPIGGIAFDLGATPAPLGAKRISNSLRLELIAGAQGYVRLGAGWARRF